VVIGDRTVESVPIPGEHAIRALHEKHAPSRTAFQLVYTHCEIVWAIARQLINRGALAVDTELVRAGSLLHDLGVYALYGPSGELDHANYVRHGLLGHELLAGEGLPEELCRFCSCHTGVGLTAADVRSQRLPLPPADYRAESLEEQLVMYADKFHSKTDPPVFVSAESAAAGLARFGEDKRRRFAALRHLFGTPDLRAFIAKYGSG
jgi:uncharacterized protein